MTTLNVTWTNPSVSSKQLPLAGVQVFLAVASASPVFSQLTTVPAPGSAFQQTEIDPGDYVIRLIVVDIAGKVGPSVDTPFNVPADAPGAVVNVSVTLS